MIGSSRNPPRLERGCSLHGQVIRDLGGIPGTVKKDLEPLLRDLDVEGDGRVSIPALMDWAGRTYLSVTEAQNKVSDH